MSKKQNALIEQQQNYLDFCLAEEPYRRVVVSDKANARAELAQLRANIEEWHNEADRRAHVGIRDRSALQAAQECIAEQARQLAEARSLIDEITDDYIVLIDKDGLSYVSTNIIIDMINWLAANPAPEAEPQP